MEIVKANYVFYITSIDNPDIKPLIQNQKISYISPTTLFMHDPFFIYLNNNELVLYKFEGFLEYDTLCEKISDCSSKINKKGYKQVNPNNNFSNNTIPNKNTGNKSSDNKNNNNKNNNLYSDYVDETKLSNVELMEKQKRELEEMEKQLILNEQKKKEKELEKKKEVEALRKKISQERHSREDFKNKLIPEPSDKEKDVAIIKFRMPDGETLERRFLKTMKVEQLYCFVGSRDNVLMEEDSSFDLINQFPFKEYNDLDKTLEEEGLFPRVTVQVREK